MKVSLIKLFPVHFCFLLIVLSVTVELRAEGWGNFQGQIKYNGTPPKTEVLPLSLSAQLLCGTQGILSEELIIDPKTNGIANCILWINKVPKKIHPDLKTPPKPSKKLDIDKCIFSPHVDVLRTDQKLNVINSDAWDHNVKANFIANDGFNPMLSPKDFKGVEYELKKPEILPMPIESNLYPWMRSFWLIVDHPYFAVTDKQGRFVIKNLPVGEHTFTLWQEKAGFLNRKLKVKIQDGKTETVSLSFDPEVFGE